MIAIALLPSFGHAARFDRFYGALGLNLFDSADGSSNIVQESNGVSASLALGRYLSHRDHISFDVAYSKIDSSSKYMALIHQVQSSRILSVGTSLNAYRTFYERGRLSLYAGAGVGFVDAEIKQEFSYVEPGLSFSVKDSYERFSYNVSLNGSYRLSPRLALQAGYRVIRETGSRSTTRNTLSLSIRLSMARGATPQDSQPH